MDIHVLLIVDYEYNEQCEGSIQMLQEDKLLVCFDDEIDHWMGTLAVGYY
jgi:hypothetical protein